MESYIPTYLQIREELGRFTQVGLNKMNQKQKDWYE